MRLDASVVLPCNYGRQEIQVSSSVVLRLDLELEQMEQYHGAACGGGASIDDK